MSLRKGAVILTKKRMKIGIIARTANKSYK